MSNATLQRDKMNTRKIDLSRHAAWLAIGVIGAGLMTTGCGKRSTNYFEYDNEADEISGKINLALVTEIRPQLIAGRDELRLNEQNIRHALERLKDKDYTEFRVKAVIQFDDRYVTLYESELFEKGKNDPDSRDIRKMEKALKRVLSFYNSI